MTDGDQLKQFIDNQTIPKVKIAEALGMSRQNLFSLFKSRTLEPETKVKFEKYFNETIFTNVDKGMLPQGSNSKRTHIKPQIVEEPEINFGASHTAELLQSYKDQIHLLKQRNKYLEEDILTNLKMNREYLKAIMAQVKAASRLYVDHWAGANRKKLDEVLHKLDTYAGEFLNIAE